MPGGLGEGRREGAHRKAQDREEQQLPPPDAVGEEAQPDGREHAEPDEARHPSDLPLADRKARLHLLEGQQHDPGIEVVEELGCAEQAQNLPLAG